MRERERGGGRGSLGEQLLCRAEGPGRGQVQEAKQPGDHTHFGDLYSQWLQNTQGVLSIHRLFDEQ